MQRTLTIAAIALVLIGLGMGTYFYFATKPSITVTPESGDFPVAGQGTTGSGTTPTTVTDTETSPNVPISVSARLVQISTGPVVFGTVVVDGMAADASTTPEVSVNYIERVSGNVFTYLPRTRSNTRINNKTIPGIQSASWLPDGSFAVVRYLSGADFSTINTYALSATSSDGFFLPQNLSDATASSIGILAVASGVNGSSVSLSNTDGSHTKNLFTTPLTSLRALFAGKDQYLIFSKPSSSLLGDAFLVDKTGHFSRVAGPKNGLVALPSHSGKFVYVSYSNGSQIQTELIDTTTGTSTTIPVSTIVDKCVWTVDDSAIYCGIPASPNASYSYPDDWYQGAVHFSDKIWKIDVTGHYAKLVLDFSEAKKGDLDAVSLAVNPANTTLVFVNKNDGSLWSYSL